MRGYGLLLACGLFLTCVRGETSVSSRLSRLLPWCCGFENTDALCTRDCANKRCDERCEHRCGFFGAVFCGARECKDMKNECINIKPADKLTTLQSGPVFEPGSPEYEANRVVFNGACDAKPLAVVVPNTREDISAILKYANDNNIVVSKRSGGHSYTCNSLVNGAIHLNLKNFNRVNMLETSESPTNLAAWLGTGATWGKVLRGIDHSKYSYPHGQCRSVGVGGFLLGGGVNWLGTYNKYGYGAEYILKMKAVLADGSLVTVYPDRTEYQDGRVVVHTPATNLFNGLRGAGSSLAVVTEFLYRINRSPETRPAIVLIWIENQADIDRIHQAAKSTSDYSFMINQPISVTDFWTYPRLGPLMNTLPLALQTLRVVNGKSTFPLQLMVTDIRAGAGKSTDIDGVIGYLKSQGVSLLTDNFANSWVLRPVALAMGLPIETRMNGILNGIANMLYEDIEQEQESWEQGKYGSVSLNFGSLKDSSAYASELLDNPFVGLRRSLVLQIDSKECDFCFWMVHFRNRQGQTQLGQNYPITIRTDGFQDDTQEINLTCMFKTGTTSCPSVVNSIKDNIYNKLGSTPYSKYYNFPSCKKEDSAWKDRYWGPSVPQLMSIKQTFDPKDIFKHCQSLTSTDPSCCPFSA